MKNIGIAARYEFSKMLSRRAWWIVVLLVLIIQPVLALVNIGEILHYGLDATPEQYPELATAIPSVEYLGIDMMGFGQFAIIILGAILGASEYRDHELRTTQLCISKRSVVFFAKLLTVMASSFFLSLAAAYLTVAITHIGLGSLGLNPITLSVITWQYIGYATINWVLLIVLSFGFGMLCRNAIIPLIFFLPQLYGLGIILATKWEWGKYLPVAASNLLIATPNDIFTHDPLRGSLALVLWTFAVLLIAYCLFIRSDVGGTY
ncbi:MAG: ABC transporter permease [Lachnospiraceae bacterium]